MEHTRATSSKRSTEKPDGRLKSIPLYSTFSLDSVMKLIAASPASIDLNGTRGQRMYRCGLCIIQGVP